MCGDSATSPGTGARNSSFSTSSADKTATELVDGGDGGCGGGDGGGGGDGDGDGGGGGDLEALNKKK